VSKAESESELLDAVDDAARYDRRIIVEKMVIGREIEVSVLGNERPITSLPGEIIAGHEFYDYEAKYTPGLSETSPRAEVPERTRAMIHKIARDAYRGIGAEGFARIDFLLRGDEVYLSEINTIPGFTPISLFPVMCADGGYDFAGICRRIVELAEERRRTMLRPVLTPGDLPR